MDIQSLELLSSIAAQGNTNTIMDKGIKFGDEFEKLLQQINEEMDIAEVKKFLDEKFNVNTHVADYSCEKTDTEAEMYDTAMLEKYDMHGGRNVIISKKALLRMKNDSAFRQKVYQSIKDIPWSSKLTGGEVKGNGVFIHEDGTGGYYLEFDWNDDEKIKQRKHKVTYSSGSQVKELNPLALEEVNNMGLQADILISLMGADFNYKREEQ